MADGHQRSAQEREAARRERERRRPRVFDDEEPLSPVEPPLSAVEPSPTAEHDVLATDGDEEDDMLATDVDDGHDGDGLDDGAPDVERPSGTRRVSRLRPEATKVPPRTSRPRPPQRPRRTPTHPRRGAPTGRRQRRYPWLGRMVALIMVALAAVLIWFVVELLQPFGTSPHGEVTVIVPAHSGAREIGDLLAQEGVVPSGFFFELRAELAGKRGKLRSGSYRFEKGMSYSAALTKLTTPPPVIPTTQLTIAEGHTRQYVARLLRRQRVKGNYLAATRRSRLLDPHAYGAPRHVPSLEGFLFPDTFRLADPIKMSALVDAQLRDFKKRFATVNLDYVRSKHLTSYDVLTIASLIEGEAATPRDLPLVASVIYNRLRDGMALQLDSTTRYATGNFTRPLTESQLQDPSPYNTRVHTGLPPTPINNPGLAAIRAAAHPAQTSYLYFFTKPCTNRSVFTTSYTQFLNLLAVDRRNHC